MQSHVSNHLVMVKLAEFLNNFIQLECVCVVCGVWCVVCVCVHRGGLVLYTHVLSCSSHFLWHLPPRGVLKIFGLVIVWGYLQQPLVLNFNCLGME